MVKTTVLHDQSPAVININIDPRLKGHSHCAQCSVNAS